MRYRNFVFFWLVVSGATAQPPVAPSPEPVGPPRGTELGTYNLQQNFEVGYRFRSVGGDIGKYRSDVNFGNGVRLLGSSIALHSREGNASWFHQVLLTTQGLAGDPYQFTNLRIEKTNWYRYEMWWRLNEYFNPALTVAGGYHALDTRRGFQDHDVTLLPQSPVRFFFGITRNRQTGAGLSTVQLFDGRGDEYPLFANIDRRRQEYRAGNEVRLFGARLNWIRGWDRFEERSPLDIREPQLGINLTDENRLNAFARREPIEGTNNYWRVGLFRDNTRLFAFNGRFTYTSGRHAFVLDETALGTNRFGAAANRQIASFGNARRPVATGNLTLTLLPASRVSLTNHTAVYNIRTEGDSFYREFNNASLDSNLFHYEHLGIRTLSNASVVNLRLRPSLGIHGGYQYASRRIRSLQITDLVGLDLLPPELRRPIKQENRLHAGSAGFRWKPVKSFSINLDGEIGRADRPIFPTSDRNYHGFGARFEYRTRSFRAAAWSRLSYNFNSVSLAAYSARSRNYAADLTWTARSWVSLDAGYTQQHLDTAGAIAYFLRGSLVEGEQSLYFSKIHSGYLTARFSLRNRVDFHAGYHHVQDTGDGRATLSGSAGGSALADFRAVQTFPLAFQSPLVRLSLRLRENLRWNAGYQYYGYREDLLRLQGYRAHTGYTGMQWSF